MYLHKNDSPQLSAGVTRSGLRLLGVGAGLLSCTLVAACSGGETGTDPGAPGTGAGAAGSIIRVDVADSDFVPKATFTTFDWGRGEPGVTMQPVSTHVCVLSRVKGELDDGPDRGVEVVVGTDNKWHLSGWAPSSGNSLSASAVCYPHSLFRGEGDNAHMVSQDFLQLNTGSGTVTQNMWWSDAASFISSIVGDYRGGGEKTYITQAIGAKVPSVLAVASQVGDFGWTEGHGFSYFVGQPGGAHVAKFIGPSGTGTADVAGEYSVSTASGPTTLTMALATEAMCYFTRISGKFDGGGESLQIAEESLHWTLRARAGGGSAYGRARCFKLNQR